MPIHPPTLDLLRQPYHAGDLVVFVGAGVPMAAGLPSWPELARKVLAAVDPDTIVPSQLAGVASLLNPPHLIDALSYLQRIMGTTAFVDAVYAALDDTDIPVPPVATAIAALAPTLRAIVTTNLDRFLERALQGAWPAVIHPPLGLAQRKHYILKLHGSLPDRTTWVLTTEEYDALLHRRPGLAAWMQALYLTRTFLFVGYGLSDPDLDHLLGFMRAFADGQPPRHYALVPADSVDPGRLDRLSRAGIRLLRYDNADGKHAEVERILRELAATQPGLSTDAEATNAALSAPSVASLSHLHLLFLAANPEYTDRTLFDQEIRQIEDVLARHARGRIDLKSVFAAQRIDVQSALVTRQPHIVHFSMHGSGAGLSLQGPGGEAATFSPALLLRSLASYDHSIRLLTFNACFTDELARDAVSHVPCAIGMAGTIDPAAAVAYAEALYMTIAAGGSLHQAHEFACTAALDASRPGHPPPAPRLYCAPGIDARRVVLLR